jgi:FkbM family methyltransferase
MRQVLIEKHYAFHVAQPPRTIIDAGANIGLSAVYFANRFPEAKIVAVEPESSNFEILRQNVSGYSNVLAIRAALWHSTGMISLVDPGVGHHGFQTSYMVQSDSKKVSAVTIEDILKEINSKSIDLLKVDIEGSEKELFESCSPWIGKVRMIMVELHEHLRPGCTDSFTKATAAFEDGGRCGESLMVYRKLA